MRLTPTGGCDDARLRAGGHLFDNLCQGRPARCDAGRDPGPKRMRASAPGEALHVTFNVVPARFDCRRRLRIPDRRCRADRGPARLQPDGQVQVRRPASRTATSSRIRRRRSRRRPTSCRSTRSSCRPASRPSSGQAAIAGARTMVMGDKGTMFMGTRVIGRVYAITDKDGKREAKVLLQGLTQPNGLAFKDGSLYVFAINKVYRYDKIEDNLDKPPEPVELTANYNLPDTIHHNWKYVAIGPDGKMYVQVGSNCNICETNPGIHGQIRRYNARRHRHGDRGARRPQHGRLRLASGDQGVVVHRQRPRLGRQRRTGRRAQPHSEEHGRRELRLPVLPRDGHSRSGRQASESVRRRDHAGRADRTACRRARHQVLHRRHVPEAVQERRVHRAARLLEPRAEVRL